MAHKKTGGAKRSRSKGAKKSRSSASPSPAAISEREMKKFRAESDLRALREAEDIRGDSSRMSAARTMAKKEMAALKKV